MYNKYFNASSWSALALVCGLVISPLAAARCGCPDDGHGAPNRAFGLGESFPQATDLAVNPAWQVYEFERDGIRYVQVNDQYGTVRAAVGRIDNTFWVMPLGADADRVLQPNEEWPIGQGTVLVQNSDLLVVQSIVSGQTRWLIQAP